MDKIVQPLATAFGVAVSAWSVGAAVMIPVFVKSYVVGWQHFQLDEYQTAALAAFIAGPVALVLRWCGFKPACPPQCDLPPAPTLQPEEPS